LRVENPATLLQVDIDDQVLALGGSRWNLAAGGIALGATAILALILGLEGFIPLVSSPLGLLAPRFGIPFELVLALIAATSAFAHVRIHGGIRRQFAFALAASMLLIALWIAIGGGRKAHTADWLINRALASTLNKAMVEQKVKAEVSRGRRDLARLSGDKPLIVAMGSSSSGGGTPGRWWPVVLAEMLPKAEVLALTDGGATTWHLRQVLERLDLKPDACVFFFGHNDTLPTFPGITLKELMHDQKGRPGTWVAPVPIEDARENIEAMARRCARTIGMVEYSINRLDTMHAYAQMIKSIPGVEYFDVIKLLSTKPVKEIMRDDVHPLFNGHQMIGEALAREKFPEYMADP